MPRAVSWVLLGLGCLAAALAWAPAVQAEEQAASQPPSSYRLQVGDVVAVTVQDQPAYSFPSLTVTPDGKISYPLAGEIVVEGKTVAELTAILVKVLKQELRDPQVTVSIVRAQPRNVYVLGEVQKPGPYDLMAAKVEWISIPAAIGMAGGYTAAAQRTYVTLIRGSKEPEQVSLQMTDPAGLPLDPGIKLYPGDTIVIPRAADRVSVLGEVVSPGQYELLPVDNVLTMLAKAKGLTAEADQERALLLRANGTRIEINLRGLKEGTIRAEQLPPLQNGDTLLFLEARNDVVVLGEVATPGSIALLPRMTVADALAKAGGPTPEADLEHVEVIDRQGGKRTLALADEKGQLTADQLAAEQAFLKGGETIIVPRLERFVSVLGYVKSPGRVAFQPGETVADVVARAGGPLAGEARPDQTLLIRPGAQPGQSEAITCDLTKVLRGEPEPANVPVKHLDIVYVPGTPEMERMGRKEWIRTLLQLGSILAIWNR
jgi:polysaccharide export outer membrane protein